MAEQPSPPNAEPLHAGVLDWLVSPDDPSVRFFALTELLGEPAEGGEAAQARREIMTQGAVPRILAAQKADGHFCDPARFYVDKYRGTVWQLMILAELGADPGDARVRAACEAVLRDSQHADSGGLSCETSRKTGGGLPSGVVPCLTGNLVFSLIRLGYLDDPRLQRAIDWIATYQRFDDNDGDAPTGGPYDRYEMCWGRHTCHMGAAKALKALAEIPPERRSPAVVRTLAGGTEYFLKHHVHKRSHDLTQTAKPGWRRFQFPLMYQTDALEILGILAKLGVLSDRVRDDCTRVPRDARTQEALDLVHSRQDADGRWTLQQTFNGRFHVDIEAKGEPSRWVTLKALQVLKAAGRLQARPAA